MLLKWWEGGLPATGHEGDDDVDEEDDGDALVLIVSFFLYSFQSIGPLGRCFL